MGDGDWSSDGSSSVWGWGRTPVRGVRTSAVLDQLKGLLTSQRDLREGGAVRIDKVQLATAALLVEAAHMDAEFGARERAKIGEMVESRFGLSAAEVGALLEAADEKVEQSVEVFGRSEEHTSELQSLMRISYADFCLKK